MDKKRTAHKIQNYMISKENLKNFEVMNTRRLIRKAKVLQIKTKLINGDYVDLTFKINKCNAHYRIMDGNHRFEAIRLILYDKKYETMKFKIELHIFENLGDEEEIEMYDIFNLHGTVPSKDDSLQLHKNEITFFGLIKEKGLPANVTIYKNKDSIRFAVILDALTSTIRAKESVFKPIVLTKSEVADFAKNLLYDDFILLSNFLKDFISVFGNVGLNNAFCRTPIFSPLLNIYYTNIDKFGSNVIKVRMRKLIGEPRLIQFSRTAGRMIQSDIRDIMVSVMSKGYTKNVIK